MRERSLNKRLLIVCGGARTEKDYLNALRTDRRRSNISIKICIDERSPLHVVKKAADIRSADPDAFDEYWAVFDVDEFDVKSAIALAREKGIQLAISNPCFEYWLLLHFCEINSHLENYKATVGKLKKHLQGYDKDSLRFSDYSSNVELAIQRAKKRDGQQEPPGVNPNTGVWRVVQYFVT